MKLIKNMIFTLMSLFSFRKKYALPILILDTASGLCNQMKDIETFASFCIANKYRFSFRYCCFRNSNLTTFYYVDFQSLFDVSSFKKLPKYSYYSELDFKGGKTLNAWPPSIKTSLEAIDFLKSVEGKYSHIFIPQFWPLFDYENSKIHSDIKIEPSKKIKEFFLGLKSRLPERYNFLHYRYEHDFLEHFKIDDREIINTNFPALIQKNIFKKNLPIYLSCSSPLNVLKNIPAKDRKNIFYNDETSLHDFNFEESAYIDYLVGEASDEVVGHSRSSFSQRLSQSKNTSSYYDL